MSLRRNVLVCLIASGCLLTGTAGNLRGQYEQMKLPDAAATNEARSALMTSVRSAVKETGQLSAASKEALKAYAEYLMAEMTRPSISDTPDKRRAALQNQLIVATKSDEGRATVAKAIVAKSVEIVDGNYIPQAKVNAMLMLCDSRLSGDALSPLYKYATNTAVAPHLRSLALFGLDQYVRGAGSKMPAAQRNQLAKAMAEIAKSEPTLLKEEKAHWWMVRRAFDVLGGLHSPETPSPEGAKLAMALFMEPTTVPSVRISAGQYLTNYDLSGVDDATRNKILVSVAQVLDQEVVGWYEQEQDKTQSSSGAMGMMPGGYGGMGMGMGTMGSGTGSGSGYGSDSGGYGGLMGGYESAMGGAAGGGPKPIDTQKWDLRLARRKLNTYCQLAHILLMGNGASEEKDFSATGKGIMENDLPESLQRPGRKLLEALELVQTSINERTLSDTTSLMTRSVKALDDLRTAAEDIPGMTGADGSVIVPSFNELSPRKKSFKKADAKKALEAPKTPEQIAAEQAAAAGVNPPAAGQPPADGADPAAGQGAQPGQPGQPGAAQPQPNPAQPGNQPQPGAPAANNGNQPAANQPAANQPAANQPAANQPAANQPAANQPAANQPAGDEPADQ